MTEVLPENAESQRAWDGVLFDRFLRYKHLIVTGLAQHGAVETFRVAPQRDIALGANCVHDRPNDRHECLEGLSSLEENRAIVLGQILLRGRCAAAWRANLFRWTMTCPIVPQSG